MTNTESKGLVQILNLRHTMSTMGLESISIMFGCISPRV